MADIQCICFFYCSAVQVGKRILFFGGGAASTNRIAPPPTLAVVPRESSCVPYLSVDQKVQRMVDELLRADVVRSEEDADTVEPASPIDQEGFAVHLPDVASVLNAVTSRPILPRPRLSAAAALVGRHWVVVGGFSGDHNQMGDVWVSACCFSLLLSREYHTCPPVLLFQLLHRPWTWRMLHLMPVALTRRQSAFTLAVMQRKRKRTMNLPKKSLKWRRMTHQWGCWPSSSSSFLEAGALLRLLALVQWHRICSIRILLHN